VFCLWVPLTPPDGSDAPERGAPQPERRIFLLSR
jgi:hypothetical protein